MKRKDPKLYIHFDSPNGSYGFSMSQLLLIAIVAVFVFFALAGGGP